MRGSGWPVSQRRAAPHIRLTRTQSYKSDNLELVSEPPSPQPPDGNVISDKCEAPLTHFSLSRGKNLGKTE